MDLWWLAALALGLAIGWWAGRGRKSGRRSGEGESASIAERDEGQDDFELRRRALEAMRLNHARWQALGEALAGGVVLLGHHHRILLTNYAARKMLEVLDPSAGLPPADWTSREIDSGSMQAKNILRRLGTLPIEEVLDRHREPRPVEIRIGEGRQRVFEAKANPVVAGGGGEWVLALSEVTEERETERKLWLRERMAAVGQLAAGIAHDFNNILQSISLAAEISRSGAAAEDEETVENLDVILHQSRRAADLVRQILDFARQSPTQPQTLELGPFVQEVVALLRRTLSEAVRWELELHREVRVRFDPAQLQQLLTNLTVNADAAMPQGGTIRIALDLVELGEDDPRPFDIMEAGSWATLTVSDTGSGIPPQITERIFEPFYSTKDRSQGTGLGLAQVYGIVKQHGGFIDLDSAVGKGTTFVIYLPPASAEEEFIEETNDDESEIPHGRGQLVLVVDDDKSILRGARMALISFGYRVISAESGEAALELHQRHGDDITMVLTDVAMPGMGGPELVQELHARGSQAAILFMSGYAPGDGVGEEPPEAFERLAKPFSLEELADAVSRTLGLPAPESPGDTGPDDSPA